MFCFLRFSTQLSAQVIEQPDQVALQAPQLNAEGGGLHLGPIDVHPYFAADVIYDDNIYIQSNSRKTNDLIWSFSPGAVLTLGELGDRFVTLNYAPSFVFFTDLDQNNSIDHNADLLAEYRFAKLTLGVHQQFQVLSGNVIDIANRVDRHVYNTDLTSSYQYSDKTSFEINARQVISDYSRFVSTKEWINQDWFNYSATPKITFGLGLTFGYVEVQNNPHQTYEQGLVRVVYHASQKLDFNVSGGGEVRQFEGGAGSKFNPVFSLGATYAPRDGTTLTLTGSRTDRSSLIGGFNYTSTTITMTARQRFLQRFFLTLTGGYQNADYHSTVTGLSIKRTDNYFFFRPSVDWQVAQHWTAGLFYFYRQNDSTARSFTNNQIGGMVTARF